MKKYRYGIDLINKLRHWDKNKINLQLVNLTLVNQILNYVYAYNIKIIFRIISNYIEWTTLSLAFITFKIKAEFPFFN